MSGPVPPDKQPVLDDTPRVPQSLGTAGVPNFPDTFFGPRDKRYQDFNARQATRLRGTNLYYYILRSQTQRMDGSRPLEDRPDLNAFDRRQHSQGATREEAIGLAAMYGEPLVLGARVDSVRREVTPSWDYADPVAVRGVIIRPDRMETPDERGTIYVRRFRLDLARVLCGEEWDIRPYPGDVVRLPNLLGNEYAPGTIEDGYYDVESVDTNASRFGATGFYTVYQLALTWQSKYDPMRKLPERIIKPQLEPPV